MSEFSAETYFVYCMILNCQIWKLAHMILHCHWGICIAFKFQVGQTVILHAKEMLYTRKEFYFVFRLGLNLILKYF